MLNYTCLHFSDLDNYELFDVLALRQEVFIIEQNCIYNDADEYDPVSWHVLGQDHNSKLFAYARIIPDSAFNGEFIKIGRVVTSPIIRRTGEGKLLMVNSIEFAIELYGSKKIKISAQTYLKHFYSHLGFKVSGEPYLEDGIPHVAMILDCYD